MKVGITLPQFRDEADTALEAARQAEELGIDGVFVFDHLWPMGQPGRPALSSGPLLGALAASTSTIHLGTLVARIGLVPDEVLIDVLCGVDALSGGRLVAGIGTGDKLSAGENEAYGIPFEPAEIRRDRLLSVAAVVAAAGIPTWIGGGRPEMVVRARAAGAAVNVWQVGVDEVGPLGRTGGGHLGRGHGHPGRRGRRRCHLGRVRLAGVLGGRGRGGGDRPLRADATG